MAKAEIERLKTELLKYELKDQQYKIDLDNKKLELERGFIDMAKDKEREIKGLASKAEGDFNKNKEDKMIFDSQRQEMMQKNKQFVRKLRENEDQMMELQKQVSELRSLNTNLRVKMDEMDNLYRAKLMQYSMEEKTTTDKKMMGFNAKEDLIRSYREKEVELMEKLDKERAQLRATTTELLALKNYSRELKYLAEDWAPQGQPLPPILTEPAPSKIEQSDTAGMKGGDMMQVR